jgi:hypothetical protein
MSACNGIVHPDAVYLLTDGAVFDSAHVVTDIGRKVMLLDDARMAIAWTGHMGMPDLEAALAATGAVTQAEIMRALPGVLRGLVQLNADKLGAAFDESRDCVRLLIALWNDTADEPQLWVAHSNALVLGPAYRPFAIVRLMQAIDLPPEGMTTNVALFERLTNPATFDLDRDGVELLEIQRHHPWDDGSYCVGGFAHATTVTREGVSQRVLKWWPDQVGARIDPLAVPTSPAGFADRFRAFARHALLLDD